MTDKKLIAGEVAAAKALCKHHAEVCGVDADDQWKFYSEDFLTDARIALSAALSQQPECGKAQVQMSGRVPEFCCVHSWNAAKASAWNKRQLSKCKCDHNEYCIHCFPPEFERGGKWFAEPDFATPTPDHPQSPDAGALVEALELWLADYDEVASNPDFEPFPHVAERVEKSRASLAAYRAQGKGAEG